MNTNTPIIAIVEDNDDDLFAMRRALARAGSQCPLQIFTDGQEALDYLQGKREYANRNKHPPPSILFLDLKLPFVNGFEVLEFVRKEPSLADLPVVVLTSSPESRDHTRAYALGAREYLVKPPTPEMIRQVLTSLGLECRTASHPVPAPQII